MNGLKLFASGHRGAGLKQADAAASQAFNRLGRALNATRHLLSRLD